MHFHINNVTGIWIGNYNHLVSSLSNIPQFPHFGGYTKILTEIGRSPFHHTFTKSSRQTQQSISRVDCHFFQAVILPSVLHAGGTAGGGAGRGNPNLPPPTSCALHSQLALSILASPADILRRSSRVPSAGEAISILPLAPLALFRLRNIKHRCVIFL